MLIRRLALVLAIAAWPSLALANDRMDCAVNAGRNLTADQIILNCGLTHEEAAEFREYFAASESREKEMLRRQIETQNLVLEAIQNSAEYGRMVAAGVTEEALIELARRITAEVQDPGQAFAELRKAVEIAISVQEEAKTNPSTDAFVAEVQRRVAALAADSKFDEANQSAEDALALWEADQEEQRRRGIELHWIAFDQNLLAREFDAAAEKRVRIADLEAGGMAGVEALRSVAVDHYQQGLRFGATSDLRLAIAITDIAMARAETDLSRAILQDDNGIHKWVLGSRIAGPEGAALLAEAVVAYHAALEVMTREDHPVRWARTQNNLGAALRNQGSRNAGPEGAALLGAAVEAYRAALEVTTREAHPVDWAQTQNNLGIALAEQGSRISGPEGAVLLGEAVEAYRAALEVRTRGDHPLEWAQTQNNLGIALRNQGSRKAGPEGAALLGEAVLAYRAALEVHTREDHPVRWATTQNNLGAALQEQGIRSSGREGAALLGEAVVAYRAALEIRTQEDHPLDWAQTQNNLGAALQEKGTRTAGPEGAALLAEAVVAYRAALEIRTREAHPVDWALTQGNLARAEIDLAAHDSTTNPEPHLEAALDHVTAALEVFDPDHMSYNHAKATRLREIIESELAALAEAQRQ